jgi:hypothetical protein
MDRKSNTEEFIKKAILIHGDKYDYSNVKYTKSREKVVILCPEHGEFLQTPNNHLQGKGCKKCVKGRLSSTEKFVKKAVLIHHDKYNYHKVDYINCKIKVVINCKKHGDFLQTPDNHLKGKGCAECGKMSSSIKQRSNKEDFVKKAILIHGESYDYSNINYINSKEKVVIICKVHGEFLQKPESHLAGSGCNNCGNLNISKKNKSNKETFIEKAIVIHNYKYNYFKVDYNNCSSKVIIICQVHGEFLQKPESHLAGNGCQKCSCRYRPNTKEFIEKCKKIHNDKYCYDNVNYVKNNIKVIIVCELHGEFSQTPQSHLAGNGCPRCKKNYKSDTKDFIRKCKEVHSSKYDYSIVEYIKSDVKVNIICKLHGGFSQTPHSHLGGTDCPKCANSGFSKPQIQWLEFLSKLNNTYIQHIMNEGEFKIPTTRYRADGYCEETNTVYEFHGDYFHGNPKIYKPEELNTLCNTTHGKLYESTVKKEEKIKKLGFNLVIIWESDWNTINKSIAIFQKRVRLIINK